MKKIILIGIVDMLLTLSMEGTSLAVWPPSTALGQQAPDVLYGFILIAFVTGIVVGAWVKRNRNERQ